MLQLNERRLLGALEELAEIGAVAPRGVRADAGDGVLQRGDECV